jgi:hypothetical protein
MIRGNQSNADPRLGTEGRRTARQRRWPHHHVALCETVSTTDVTGFTPRSGRRRTHFHPIPTGSDGITSPPCWSGVSSAREAYRAGVVPRRLRAVSHSDRKCTDSDPERFTIGSGQSRSISRDLGILNTNIYMISINSIPRVAWPQLEATDRNRYEVVGARTAGVRPHDRGSGPRRLLESVPRMVR